MKPFKVAVMYGSQTGNAQSIAEGIHDGCQKKGVESTLLKCDAWKKMNPELKEWSALVLVVSTTGNGDAPENSERFWRFMKRRTQPKDLLKGLAFSVLGLGDTNYDKFCYMGKSFDKRLRELGAVPFLSPAFADEATNMEETIEPWLASLYASLETLRGGGNGSGDSDVTPQETATAVAETPEEALLPVHGREEGGVVGGGGDERQMPGVVQQEAVVVAAGEGEGGNGGVAGGREGKAAEEGERVAAAAPAQEKAAAAKEKEAAAEAKERAAAAAVAAVAAQEEAAREKAAAASAAATAAAAAATAAAAAAAASAAVAATAAAEKTKPATPAAADAGSRSNPSLAPQQNGSDNHRLASPPASNGTAAGNMPPASQPLTTAPGSDNGVGDGGGGGTEKVGDGDGAAAATPGTAGSLLPHRIAVMYGSQTGNAQSIAEGIHDGCKKRGLVSTLLACDGWKKMKPELKEWSALVLVVSTTGNGDAPENTERFWRFLKRRAQPKDLLEGLAFTVLGLGDTNYDKFCHMGKSFDKRLRELGAVPFLAPAFADEATNMEETIEPWLASLYPALRSTLEAAVSNTTVVDGGVTAKGHETTVPESSPDTATATASVSDTPSTSSAAAATTAPKVEGDAAVVTAEAQDVTEAIRGAAAAAFQEEPVAGVADGLVARTTTAGVAPTKNAAKSAAATEEAAGAEGAAQAVAELTLSDPAPTPSSSSSPSAVPRPGQARAPTADETPLSSSGSLAPSDTSDPTQPQQPWSPSIASGARPLSDFLSADHLQPGYAPSKSELPRSRPSASSVRFHIPAADGTEVGADADGEGQQQQQQQNPWLRRARQRSSSMESRHTLDWPFSARVRSARYLTEGGRQAERRVIHMELSLKGSGISYEPGDVIGLRCPNPEEDTAYVLERLQSCLPEGAGPDVPFQHSLRSLPNPCSLRDALSHRLDLRAPLRRPVLRALSECCEDAAERAWMELLCAKTSGAAIYAAYVTAQSLTLCELLEDFPSCKPAPGVLLALLPPLPPRLYSVASSQLATPDSVAVAFSVVSFQLPHAPSAANGVGADSSSALTTHGPDASAASNGGSDGRGEGFVTRRGLCTNWLEGILAPLLAEEGATTVMGGGRGEVVSVPVFLKPTKEFLLPASAKWPCVLIGPGTGVSPFIGFLKHREEQQARRRETADAVCSGYWRGGYEIALEGEEDEATAYRGREGRGDMWLLFGCRNECQDWIFRREMEEFLAMGTLSKLSTAFSRDASEKVYVQHRIKEHGAELTRLMLQEGAYVYVCGDGNAMAQGVHKALVEALVEHGEALGVGGEKEAEAALKVMKEKNRFVLDVWS